MNDIIKIKLENCNNVDLANVFIEQNKLNIKFAPNGTGKSTLARAITLGISDKESLKELLPFKYRNKKNTTKSPSIVGIESFKSFLCFNEEYVNQFVFQQDELLSNSFDVLIRNEEYKKTEEEIETFVIEVKQNFTNNLEIENIINTLNEMSSAFKLTSSGISKASTGMKGLSNGNKIEHIPEDLIDYKPFIQSKKNTNWVNWQIEGCTYSELSNICPFCTSNASLLKDKIQKVGKEYDKNIIKNLVSIIDIISRLGEYLAPETNKMLTKITNLNTSLEDEHIQVLVSVKNQIDILIEKLRKLKTLSSFEFKEGEEVKEKLTSFKIDLEFLTNLKCEKMEEIINPINLSLENIIAKTTQLVQKIGMQRSSIKKTISSHESEINSFLAYAGYKYKVKIEGVDESARLKLLHSDYEESLSGGRQHLSFGERNAFAIVLFMYECLSKKPDLIILDDPISSFDKNKKYAILEMLFRRKKEKCLKEKTVLMLTHDIEPIIDTVKSVSNQFKEQITSSFLKLTIGSITELPIEKKDIKIFAEICETIFDSNKNLVLKSIYLRRHYEIYCLQNDGYQVLSNLFHKRASAECTDSRVQTEKKGEPACLGIEKFNNGCNEIKDKIQNFSYEEILDYINDKEKLLELYKIADNGYEKLQIFRLFDHKTNSSVIQKFINECYHIENEFICQLDPTDYDTIPEYIIKECDNILESLS